MIMMMATKLLLLSPPPYHASDTTHHHPWPPLGRVPASHLATTRRTHKKSLIKVVSLSSLEHLINAAPPHIVDLPQLQNDGPSYFFLLAAAAEEGGGYSLASYYTSLGLFVISVPGVWSLIKRSVKSKIVKKTFVTGKEGKKAAKRVAGEIQAFFTRNNFVVLNRGETITFEGMMSPSRGQTALLTFCTCISLASVSLVLTIALPSVGNNWFWLTSLGPLAGLYYWTRATRKEEMKVRMTVDDDADGTLSELIVEGDDVLVEQIRKELGLSEKGMVYVKGLFER
ncbi:unnamed protein product [Cuscuta europaea]|uniref:Protein COFACTOR ASSEMBLY OF COMPLEX C SUBUNIT B CCB1, chloroplastic n=1 Tax=Cuscuta europaea TaxID=41803 RepID=A0A9P0ZJM6_CUSEU|nr:unnamed protein product [Cuscuta europaea]